METTEERLTRLETQLRPPVSRSVERRVNFQIIERIKGLETELKNLKATMARHEELIGTLLEADEGLRGTVENDR